MLAGLEPGLDHDVVVALLGDDELPPLELLDVLGCRCGSFWTNAYSLPFMTTIARRGITVWPGLGRDLRASPSPACRP